MTAPAQSERYLYQERIYNNGGSYIGGRAAVFDSLDKANDHRKQRMESYPENESTTFVATVTKLDGDDPRLMRVP